MNTNMSTMLPTGFENIGNTCFANSVLQCLLHTPEMYAMFSLFKGNNKVKSLSEKDDSKISIPKKDNIRSCRQRKLKLDFKPQEYCCIYWSLQEIYDIAIVSSSEPIVPMGLIEIMKIVFGEHVKFGLQQDAHEFLIMLLHNLSNSYCIKNKKEAARNDDYEFDFNSILMDLRMSDIFEGSFTSKVTCDDWKFSTITNQSFQDISLVSSNI